jgi:hypothetical protein
MFALAAGCSDSATVQGEGASKLTLLEPGAVSLERGGMAKADVRIKRENLTGDVTIRFTNLPKGVTVVDSDSKIVGDQGSYTLKAGDSADLVANHAATVTASADPGNISVSQSVVINVEAGKR